MLKHVDEAVPARVGFVDYYLCNPSFFIEWITVLLRQHKIKKPLIAVGGLFLPAILFHYELLLSHLDVPIFFVDTNKLDKKGLRFTENLSESSFEEIDLKNAISLWGVLDESR